MISQNSTIYDPKTKIEKERLQERDKGTSTRRSFVVDKQDFSTIQTILYARCGNGVVGFDLLSRSNNAQLTGKDIEPEILQEAKKKSPQVYS